MKRQAIIAVDEGTTNSKAALFEKSGAILATGSSPVPIYHPKSGWVEQDPGEIWDATVAAISVCLDVCRTWTSPLSASRTSASLS